MEWEREEWIGEYQNGETIAEISRRHGISRKALYKWISRYEGGGGLADQSRAPREHPQAVSEIWRERIRGLRVEHGRWGAPKLACVLEQRHGETPSVSTIGRVLRESGLSRPKRRIRAHGTGRFAAAEEANQTWAIDFKGWCRTRDGARCEPLTLTDQATRYLLCCQGLSSTRTEVVRPVLERVFLEYGLPERIRSDNGAPFASKGSSGLTELSVWWIECGIALERIDPGHPQQNGRHERMHRTLAEATMQPPASTMRAQQKRMDAFRREFNDQRPHQALGQKTPASVYVPSERVYSGRPSEPEYPEDWPQRSVSDGAFRWHTERPFLSHTLTGKRVALEPVQDGLWKIWFYRHWMAMWDEVQRKLWRPQAWTKREAVLAASP